MSPNFPGGHPVDEATYRSGNRRGFSAGVRRMGVGGLQASLLGPPCSCHSKGAGLPAASGLESTGEPSQFSLGVKLRKKEKGEGLRGRESQVSLSLLDRQTGWVGTLPALARWAGRGLGVSHVSGFEREEGRAQPLK